MSLFFRFKARKNHGGTQIPFCCFDRCNRKITLNREHRAWFNIPVGLSWTRKILFGLPCVFYSVKFYSSIV